MWLSTEKRRAIDEEKEEEAIKYLAITIKPLHQQNKLNLVFQEAIEDVVVWRKDKKQVLTLNDERDRHMMKKENST